MYLIILKDGSFYSTDETLAEEHDACERGHMNIIDMDDLTFFKNGEWINITEFSTMLRLKNLES